MKVETRAWLIRRLGWLALLLAAIWVVEAVQLVTGRWLNGLFGLIPRYAEGLDGIAFAPLLHGNPAHAAANSGPLVVLGTTIALTATRSVWAVNIVIVLAGGGLVWLLGQPAIHVGASGLVFGWAAFLIARGLKDRRPLPLLVAAGVGMLYGTLLWGVLPGQPGVSWESHMFGAIAGVLAVFVVPCRLAAAPAAA